MRMAPSTVPSAFIPPTPPDFHHCNTYYSGHQPPTFADCQSAFNRLPAGSSPEAWYSLPDPLEPFGLPFVIHDGKKLHLKSNSHCWYTYWYRKGSCAIQFDASGKFVEENTAQLWFAPDQIRHMAGWVIDQCVDGENTGGYITKDITSTLDYLTAPSTNIFNEMRK